MTPIPYFDERRRVLPFDKLMQLEKVDDRTFRSIVRAYSPTGGENGTYGGHVYAQAAWAAAQTVPEGFLIHNITGWFTLGGRPNEHFVYSVHKIRDGFNYCTRSVTVTQAVEKGTMFTCTCSFKRDEGSPIEYQDKVELKERFKEVVQSKEDEPMEHSAAPSQDSEWFRETYMKEHPDHFNPIPGLHLRKADMGKYNNPRAPIDRRQLTFYSLRGSLPLPTAPYPPSPERDSKISLTREANLHAAAHLYASDRNSLFIIPNHLSLGRGYTRMASLSHTVIFHVGIKDLVLPPEPRINHPNADPTLFNDGSLSVCNLKDHSQSDKDGRKWFVQESWATRAGGGRGLHMSRLWNYRTGVHIASTIQDGLVRFKAETKL
ncbi:thioesterase-like superfamily-domain-containing protein [Clohesyomyces aquaticus]|uniref:Thioesterase-like superfamily-domain-containing protein n=1 Tax=Clohesyomyces aquaticus TaxID=1231657 RepID=A0A1Y2A9R7_9PLEO|nr:thioesterase-like superfamily-domain-containing protein [Clohesyomyces aquaticus]